MINLKDDIWIEGFDNYMEITTGKHPYPDIYKGRTSEIPEDLANKCVLNWRIDVSQYEKYLFKTAKEALQLACDKPYCIIFKK